MSESAVAELETPTLESETTQAETPVESTPLAGDAGAPESVDAAPESTTSPDIESEYEAWSKTQESKESGSATPEPVQREQEQQPLVDPQQYQLARRNYGVAVQNVQRSVEAVKTELVNDYGVSETTAARLAKDLHDRVNEMHAHGLNFYGLEAATQAEARADREWTGNFKKDFDESLPKSQRAQFDKWLADEAKANGLGYVPFKDMLAKRDQIARDGHVPKAQADADRKAAFIAGRALREASGEVGGAQSGANVRGAPAGSPVTYSQILKMSPAQIAAIPDDVYQKAVDEGK